MFAAVVVGLSTTDDALAGIRIAAAVRRGDSWNALAIRCAFAHFDRATLGDHLKLDACTRER